MKQCLKIESLEIQWKLQNWYLIIGRSEHSEVRPLCLCGGRKHSLTVVSIVNMNPLQNSISGLHADFLATSHELLVNVHSCMLPRISCLSLEKISWSFSKVNFAMGSILIVIPFRPRGGKDLELS